MDYKNLVLEALHSYLIHTPFVPADKSIKWGDTMLSAIKVIETLQAKRDASEEIGALIQDLHTMIYHPIDSIADAYRIWASKKPKVDPAEVNALNVALNHAREMRIGDPVQAKRNLLAALNRMLDHLNVVDPSEKRQRFPFREELIPG